jgi:hypothetical protein
MKYFALLAFLIFSVSISAQDKHDHVAYNKLTEVKGTPYVIATVSHVGKMVVNSRYLLFIDTKSGQPHQVDFPKDAFIQTIEQVKNDTLGLNCVIVIAKTVNLDNNKSIGWNDPTQIILLSPDGKQKTQITEDRYFASSWLVNNKAGVIVITGYHDTNTNGKYDKTDKNEILVYDLKARSLISKI